MDIGGAIQAMKAGAIVSRMAWAGNVEVNSPNTIAHSIMLNPDRKGFTTKSGQPFTMTIVELLAEDWIFGA